MQSAFIKYRTAIEVPYANAAGAEVNQTSARHFGTDLGIGLTEYLRSIDGMGTSQMHSSAHCRT